MDPKDRQARIDRTRADVLRVGRLYPGDPGYRRPFTEDELDEAACSNPVVADQDQLDAEAEIRRRRENSGTQEDS